jgi:hypothetical protein
VNDRSPTPDRDEIASRLCRLADEFLCQPLGTTTPGMEWNRDVFDSLDETDYILQLEREFGVSIPAAPQNDAEAAVWSRRPFRMIDAAELILLRWGTGFRGDAACGTCKYPLAGLDTGVCPECGTRFSSQGR